MVCDLHLFSVSCTYVGLCLQATLLIYATSEREVTHLQGDAETRCQQLREAEENNCALSQRLEQLEQDATIF